MRSETVLVLRGWKMFCNVREDEFLHDFGCWAEQGDWSIGRCEGGILARFVIGADIGDLPYGGYGVESD